MWGWRETLFVGLLGTYSITGYIIRPHEPILREVGWVVCVLVQGIVLACAQYLEGWFHDTQKHKTNEESLKLAHQVCWHIFAACWTAFASVIVLAGIVIGFSGSVEARVNGELKSNILVIILYLLLTIIPVFIWMMRPCFQKSLRIILELDEMNR
jgi:magnesium-transporting ATPase (P-type)